MIKNVGLIGTGIMGEPMARNLLRAGFALTVHSRTRSRAQTLLDQGAVWADDPTSLAAQATVIVSVLPDSPDVESVYLGDRSVIQSVQPGTVCVDMSTISPATARRVGSALADRGAGLLDAPVSGGKTGAEAGTLVVMVGGLAEHLESVRPVLAAMSRHIVHCGPAGYGQMTKLCNQILCGLNLLSVCEALTFARKVGLDPEVMLNAVSSGAAASWALSNLGTRIVRHDFDPMFMIDLQQKDLRIALDMAYAQRVPLPGTGLVHQLLTANQAIGEGRDGTQALFKTLERLAGLADQEGGSSFKSEQSTSKI